MKIDEVTSNFLNILRKLSGIAVLLFVFASNSSCHADVPRCVLKNGQEGECKPLRECKKAIFSLRRGTDPEYCNYERELVCCAVSLRDDPVQYENERYEPLHSSRTPKQRLNRPSDPYITISDIYESSFANDERRRSNIQRAGRPDVARINNQDSERSYLYENTPNNVYNDRERANSPEHSDDLTNRRYYNGYNVENSFVPPGLAKKKPWVGEKTTESYYEYVTKKPNRIQGPKGPNKQHNNHHPPGHQPYPQRTTRRPEGVAYPNEWHNGPNQYPNSNINNNQNQWSTTRRNKWNQETTTFRNHHLTNVPNDPNGWPHRTSTESIRNKPSLFQQGSRPQENRPVSRPGTQGKIRTSELKCQEYSKEITENITGLPLTTDPNPVIIPVRKCVQAQQLIVGGENTTIGEFPHMAAIGFRNRNNQGISWNCGGTLISDLFVLTAAHCTSTSLGRPVKVRLGEYNLMKNDDGAYPVDYGIAEIITHPQYKPPSKYHDIALLKLTRKVKFFKHIRPACLYLDENLNTNKAIATGWGRMFYDGNVSEVLQKVVLSIVDQNTCNQLYKVSIKTEVLSRGIVDSQLCAGELSGGKDTCQGDSGGPLSITNTKCIHHIIGVTSFGKSCALPNSTGVYTKVSAYVPWIESIVWPNELQG